jgi:hypothetical protein
MFAKRTENLYQISPQRWICRDARRELERFKDFINYLKI